MFENVDKTGLEKVNEKCEECHRFKKCEEFKNKIVVRKFEKYNQYNLVYNHKSLNNDIIIKLKNLGYRKFYSDIRNLFVVFLSF